MSRTRTLGQQAADAYKLADLENFTERYPLTEVYRYVNQGNAEAYDLLVAARGYAYFGKPYYVMGAVSATSVLGPAPFSMTVSGNPRVGVNPQYVLVTEIVAPGLLGTATFRWSTDDGVTWRTALLTGASVQLPGSALTVSFSAGTYVAGDRYRSVANRPVTTPGQHSVLLPRDFYKLHNISLRTGSELYMVLEPLASNDDPYYLTDSGSSAFYQLRDGVVDLFPTPNQQWTIWMNYVPCAVELASADDTFDGINGWEDYGTAYAARKMLLKEGDIEMANMVTQDMNKTSNRISNMAPERDMGKPYQVQDIRGANGWKTRSRRYPRY